MYHIFTLRLHIFVTLIIYALILEAYFVGALNELCDANELIANVDDCIIAINELRAGGTDIQFTGTIFTNNWEDALFPKGCFASTVGKSPQDTGVLAYWNKHITGNAETNSHPICKRRMM